MPEKTRTIAVLSGDGIGPEVCKEAIKVLRAVGKRFNWKFRFEYADIGACAIEKYGVPLPDETLNTCLNADAVLLGAIGDPKFDNDPACKVRPEQGLLKLRKELGLFCNVRPVELFKGLEEMSPIKNKEKKAIDFVIYRELTGGIYFGEKKREEKSASDVCSYSEHEIERIAVPAFEAAQKRGKKLTLVDKANVLETSRLWRSVVMRVAKKFPDVQTDFLYVDNAAMQLILAPWNFDVILTENMFGDILSDEASVLTGSLGMLPSASVGNGTALFEPVHGSYPSAKGKDIANPIATILSVAMMLDYFGLDACAKEIRAAVKKTIGKGVFTQDLNAENYVGTQQMADEICKSISNTGKVYRGVLQAVIGTIF